MTAEKKYEILVFEDNPENQDIMQRRLKKRGYIVHIACDGDAGLSILEKSYEDISLILMDIEMPGMNGIEVTKVIKKNESYRHIPVIAVSANIDYREKQTLNEIGFQDTFLKPVDFTRLFRSINNILLTSASKTG